MRYLDRVNFPISLLPASGDNGRPVWREELERLIADDLVIGVGSWKRLKYVRFKALPKTVPLIDRVGRRLAMLHVERARDLVETGRARKAPDGALILTGLPHPEPLGVWSWTVEEIPGVRYLMKRVEVGETVTYSVI